MNTRSKKKKAARSASTTARATGRAHIDLDQLDWESLRLGAHDALYSLDFYERCGIDPLLILHMIETCHVPVGTLFDRDGNAVLTMQGIRFSSVLWKIAGQIGVDLDAVRQAWGKQAQVSILRTEIQKAIGKGAA